MDIANNEVIKFKEARKDFKKVALTLTVSHERLHNIENAVRKLNPMYDFLNRSEKHDYLLLILEFFMVNNDKFEVSEMSVGSNFGSLENS